MPQKYIDWDSAIAFPPPGFAKVEKRMLFKFGSKAGIIIDAGKRIVYILHDAYVFIAAVDNIAEERIFFTKIF